MLAQNKRKVQILLAALTLLAAVLIAISTKNAGKQEKVAVSCPDCNIVLISIEPLREDHLSYTGYNRETSPNIDKLAQNGLQFNNAISTSSWTLPASMSIFTSLYPSQHKVLNKVTLTSDGKEISTNLKELSPDVKTLAEVLKDNGYKTAAFTGGAALESQFGFNQGFDIYQQKDFAGLPTTIPEALNWINNNKNSKFFVYLQGYDTHGQYVPEGGYDKRFVDFNYDGNLTGSAEEQKSMREDTLARGQLFLSSEDVRFLTDIYDEKVQRADEQAGKFMEEYKKLGLENKTIFIFVSSHGEELYDHGRIDHGHSLYEELVHVPLVISGTNVPHRIINSQVSTLDIMPTILNILNIQTGFNMDKQIKGVSLLSVINGEKEESNLYPETDYRYAVFLRSVRTNSGYKYIYNPESGKEELYNLNKDPKEKENIANSDKKILNSLRNLMTKHFAN